MIRVLLLDSHAIFRRGLVAVLADTCDIQVVGEVDGIDHDGELNAVISLDWDVAIMDTPPRLSRGIELLRRLVRTQRRVLVCSLLPENTLGRRLLREGAAGFVSKTGSSDQILEAIRA